MHVQQYRQCYDSWQHIDAKNAQRRYVLRLSLARADGELLAMLLESVPRHGAASEQHGT